MEYKKPIIILIIMTIFLFGITGACASDVNDTAIAGTHNMAIESADDNNLNLDENNELLADNQKTFKQLYNDINESQDIFEVNCDYTFNNESDDSPVVINKSNFTINGYDHILSGNGQSGIFNITGTNVTLNNFVFANGHGTRGGAIYALGQITLNNATFISNNATSGGAIYTLGQITLNNATFISNNAFRGGAIYSQGQITLNNATFISNNASYGGAIAHYNNIINCSNSRFIDNHAENGPSLFSDNAAINISNTFVTSAASSRYGQIYASSSTVNIENADFINITSTYSPALYFEDCESRIVNSRFINLTAEMSAGAIAIRWSGNSYIRGCEFINTKSFKNAGAILADYGIISDKVSMIDCAFNNASSPIGGAYVQLGGELFMNNSNFTNNKAEYDGGAVYVSYADCQINGCIFDSNEIEVLDYSNNGGAIYSDLSVLNISNSRFINNSAYLGNVVYACDSVYEITGCTFANNTNAIYTDFDEDLCKLENNDYNADSVICNQTFSYQTFIESATLNLTLISNTINVTDIPCRFDLRDWGWTTSVKNQNRTGACWTFTMMGTLESAISKAYGIEFDLSENDMFNSKVGYSPYGYIIYTEGGSLALAISYLVAWQGPTLEELDSFDEFGKLSPHRNTYYDIVHIQDVITVSNDEVPECSKTKTAILNNGGLAVNYYLENDNINNYYNPKTFAQYLNESLIPNHVVTIIGWDDSFSKDNFMITPPGDGAWIAKNSWGTDWGDSGIFYISYYDKTIAPEDSMVNRYGIIFENTVPYNKNYQHDFTWAGIFVDMSHLKGADGNITYANQFESAGDDLIAGVGTYFNESGVNYTVKIYVNGQLKLTQDGISPFGGYHTIKLNEYVPVKTGDIFKAVMTSNTMPYCYCRFSRVHYTENLSFFYYKDDWVDLYAANDYIACLKVYTVDDDSKLIDNKNIEVDYNGGKYFTVKVASSDGKIPVSGASVKFTINGKTTSVKTDNNGIAKIKITDVPKKYTITTTFNGKTYKNTVTVKQVLKTTKVTVKKTAKKFSLKATLKINGKLVKGKLVTFKFNGKTYKVKTNSKGIAQKTLNKKVIKKLKKGKTYTVKVTYIKDTIKTKVIVR